MGKHTYDSIYTDEEFRDIWPEYFPSKKVERELEQMAFNTDRKKRQENRGRFVYPYMVQKAMLNGEPLGDLIAQARKGQPGTGRLWVTIERWRDNKWGPLDIGTLIESRGELNETTQTFEECNLSLEPEREADKGKPFEIRILTANVKTQPI